MELEFWATTDTGCVRERNEDNFLVDPELQLFVVCDGMGGHASGDFASAMCVRIVREYILSNRSIFNLFDKNREDPVAEAKMLELVTQAIQTANVAIMKCAEEEPMREGMGTTCSLLMLRSEHAFIAHVGDSRIYLRRRDNIRLLTEDHSYVAELVRRGKMSEAQARVSQNRNALTRAVGAKLDLKVSSYHLRTEPDDSFLLCSDGLYNYFGEGGKPPMGFFLEPDLEVATKNAIRYANQRGGMDNITCLIVHVVPPTRGTSTDFEVVRDALQQTPFLEFCTDRQLIEIIGVSRKFEISSRKCIKDWSFEKSQLFIVIQGALEIRQTFFRTNQVATRTLERGDFFGLDAFFGLTQGKVELETREQVVLLGIGAAGFTQLAEQDPPLALSILWPLAKIAISDVSRNSSGRANSSKKGRLDAMILDDPSIQGIETISLGDELVDFDIETEDELDQTLFEGSAGILSSFASEQLSDVVYPASDASADTSRALLPDDILNLFDAEKETVSYDILKPQSIPFNLSGGHPTVSSAANIVDEHRRSSASQAGSTSQVSSRVSSASSAPSSSDYISSAFNEFDRKNSDPTLRQKNIFLDSSKSKQGE